MDSFEWGVDILDDTTELTVIKGDGFQPSGNEDDFISNSIGLIDVEHQTYGRFSLGKQWSTYYDVTWKTDTFEVFGGAAQGTYNLGTDVVLQERVEQIKPFSIINHLAISP